MKPSGDETLSGSQTPTVRRTISRRGFVKGAVALGAAGLAGPLGTKPWAFAGTRHSASPPIEHVIIDCQENRSFDHYFGFAPFAGRFGPPPGYSQPDGNGGSIAPYEFADLSTPDIGHSWSAVHSEIGGGAMDGFYTTDGIGAMGYYTRKELPFYYGLFDSSTLCGNYFCSVAGPTWPNRFYLAAGTSGGITTNGVWGYGVFDYPIILDLLEAAGVSWKVYNIGWDSVPYGNTDNVFVFWRRWAKDRRTRGSKGGYLNNLERGRLPQVSFIIPSYARGWDEHPPADVSVGMGIQEELITSLRNSSAWDTSAYILTYDEHGGYFDHVPPPTLDAYGPGVRVPTWVISPYAKRSHIEATRYEHLLDAQVRREGVRPPDACVREPPVRPFNPRWPEQRGGKRSSHRTGRASAGCPRGDRRSHGVLQVLTRR
ncbi:MAG: twin-arginine translocation signal domain-containing protein [Actinomycetota bacterium]|nr:twin-arginine translocation signal domain-containing protein [Actinomycetota bacterium]